MGYRTGDTLPQRMTAKDMQIAFDLNRSRFYELLSAGAFNAFELKPVIGRRCWSGEKVQRYFAGENFAAEAVRLRRAG